MTLVPGMVVEVYRVSPRSFWTYRNYQNKGAQVTCYCKWGHKLGVIDSIFGDTVILRQKEAPSVIGIGWIGDIRPYYEEEE
jgi:hypothetical protein